MLTKMVFSLFFNLYTGIWATGLQQSGLYKDVEARRENRVCIHTYYLFNETRKKPDNSL